jgi:dienelactone hydrolase
MKRTIIRIIALVLLAAFSSAATAADFTDERCDEFLRAIQQHDFKAAEAHFDAAMQQAAPPDQLAAIWNQVWGSDGNLTGWQIVSRTPVAQYQKLIIQLRFDSGANAPMMRLVIEPSHGQIAGLFVEPPAPNAAPPAAAASYVKPASFYTEDVTVGSAPFSLGGTLTAPMGSSPFPAAVLVGGSGPNDRDEKIGPNKPFEDLAEGLSSSGIEVLRYDKRTFAHGSEMDPHHVTVNDEVIDDAVAAVNLLRARPEVDRKRIFVIGHSLGAMLAPEIASRAKPIAGIVLLAPSAKPVLVAMADQMQTLGAPAEQVTRVRNEAAEIQAHKLAADGIVEHAPASYFYDLDKRDEIATARKLGVPILILRGADDYQVSAADVSKWQSGLAGASNVKLATLPGLNHLFIKDENCKFAQCYEIAGHVGAAVISRIAEFITNSGR